MLYQGEAQDLECVLKKGFFDSLNPSFWHVQLIIAPHITNCIIDFGLNALKHVIFFVISLF